VAKIAGGQIRRVRLDPIEFAPGESQLSAEGRQYLGKIAGIMQKRPELELRLCTQYTGSDAQVLATKQGEGECFDASRGAS